MNPAETSNFIEKLEKIAKDYHAGSFEDMWIEKAGQDFEWPWIQKQIKDNSEILDLGFGDGHSFNRLKEIAVSKNLMVTVLEGASSLVIEASERATERFKIVHGFFEDHQSLEGYDLIIASHVLEHVDSPQYLLKHLATLLRPNGIILGIVPNCESIHRRLAVNLGLQPNLDTLSSRDHIVGHQRVYSANSLRSDFEQSGWTITEMRGFFLKPFSNSQLIPFGPDIVNALLAVSDEIPLEFCANLGFIAKVHEGRTSDSAK